MQQLSVHVHKSEAWVCVIIVWSISIWNEKSEETAQKIVFRKHGCGTAQKISSRFSHRIHIQPF